jgi:hypothetical protein
MNGGKSKKARWALWLAPTALLAAAWLMSPWGRGAWIACYPVLGPLGVDRWFPAHETFPLAEGDRDEELAKLGAVCSRMVDTDFSCKILETGPGGRTVRVEVRTWHPADSRRLALHIREAYESGKGAGWLEENRAAAPRRKAKHLLLLDTNRYLTCHRKDVAFDRFCSVDTF